MVETVLADLLILRFLGLGPHLGVAVTIYFLIWNRK